MKPARVLFLGLAAVAGVALWRMYRDSQARPAGYLGIPPVVAPAPSLVDIINGQSWGAAGADLARRFTLPAPGAQP